MELQTSSAFPNVLCRFTVPHWFPRSVAAGQRLTCLGSNLEGILESGREEGARRNEKDETKTTVWSRFNFTLPDIGLWSRGKGPILTKSSWSPVSSDHVFGSGTARQQAAGSSSGRGRTIGQQAPPHALFLLTVKPEQTGFRLRGGGVYISSLLLI